MPAKNKALCSLIFYVTFYSFAAKANFFSGINENITTIKNKEPLTVDLAIGSGIQVNSLWVNDGDSLATTNRNLYTFGINVNNKTKLSASLPFKDPEKSRESRVDSVVQSFALGFDFTAHLKGSLYTNVNKGYFLESTRDQSVYRLPDLEFNHKGVNFYWLYNPEHQSIYLDPFVYDKGEDSSSWISLLGLNQTELKHLDQVRQLPSIDNDYETPDSADIRSISFRQLYSRNWFWSNWYVTGALGYGVNFDSVKQRFSFESRDLTTSSANTVFSVSGGYLAKRWGLSAYTNITQATYFTENIQLNSNIGTTGLYYTYQF